MMKCRTACAVDEAYAPEPLSRSLFEYVLQGAYIPHHNVGPGTKSFSTKLSTAFSTVSSCDPCILVVYATVGGNRVRDEISNVV